MKLVSIAITVGFYALIVVFAVVLLAAAQLRLSGGAAYDTWRLNFSANRVLNDDLTDKLAKAKGQSRDDTNSLEGNQICLRLFDNNGRLRRELLDEQTMKEIERARTSGTSHQKLSGDVYCAIEGYDQLGIDIKYYQRAVKDDAKRIDDLESAMAANGDRYEKLISGHQDFLAFREMEKTWYERPFVVVPYDLLVMVLVIFMGALGGMVRLLRDYGATDRKKPTPGDYALVPLIGAVVAIGGYILAKTGLLLLSSTGGESTLSPFMVSLVGIVSGLLAKEVIDTIAAQGRRMLEGRGRGAHHQGARHGD